MIFDNHKHHGHNYRSLIRRWRSLARRSGLQCQVFATADEFELLCLRSPALQTHGGIYLSAGIHGDEAGGTEGLLFWAEMNVTVLRQLPLLLFPCLNPWGLVHNRRSDASGRDLNRSYHLDDLERIRAQKAIIAGVTFRLAMCLHEDYDAQGVYLYEVRKHLRPIGPELLAAAGYYLPVDLRPKIEGRRAESGSIARRIKRLRFPFLPEAGLLALHHSDRTITFETPSENELGARAQAQAAAIQRAVELT
ncbi:MAG TPA: M14 family metallocarboxypeptidase [Chthoniobacterales bacterium]|nr:M14 family metallocarboxypeptidase [Chthoniobacterales bacterium]